jgi:outer membrane protein OmpA-like peptidoglycan-associated protein
MKAAFVASLLFVATPSFAQFDAKALQDAAGKAATEAGKSAATMAEAEAKKEGKKVATEQVENKVNEKLLAEAKKNQCSFKSGKAVFEGKCDDKVKKTYTALLDAKKVLKDAGIEGFKFEVSGHTDSKGDAKKNKALSAQRAQKMVDELKKQGIPESEIIAIGMGSDAMLVKPDDTKEKQAKNRRYEIRVRLSTP